MGHHKTAFLIAIILIAIITFIRFYHFPEWFTFDADQETLSQMARQVLIDHKPLLIGMPTSVGGLFIGSYLVYLLVPFYWLGKMSPYSSLPFIFFLSLATCISITVVGSKIFNWAVGLLALVIYGLSTLITSFDRTFWNPSAMPLVSVWAFFFTWKYLSERKVRWLALATAMVGMMLHFHFTFVFGFGFLFLALLFFGGKQFWLEKKSLLVVGIILLFFFAPLVIFDFRHNFFISRNFVNFLIHGPEKTSNIVKPLSLIDKAMIFFSVLKATLYNFSSPVLDALTGIFLLVYSLFALKNSLVHRLILLAFGVSFVVMMVNRGPFLPYYLIFLFPLWAFLVALFLSRIQKVVPIVTICLLGLFVYFNLPPTLQSQTDLALKYKKEAVDYIVADAGSSTFKVDFMTDLGLKTGFDYLFWYDGKTLVEDMTVPTEKTYKIIIPATLVQKSELSTQFGNFGVIKVD